MNLDRLRDRFFNGVTRYRWLSTVGRGGMGVIFKAEDVDLDDVVAIKVLAPDLDSDDQELLLRFKREIQLNRKIKHPNVARLHDFGTSGDYPYITMEFIEGVDLRTLIQREGRLSPEKAIAILRQILLGTEAAHRLGIVHRDLKSQNVMVEESGAVAILDFGLARGKMNKNENLTIDSIMIGTPHYMPPEQALGKPTDARSDIYSIGVMAFEMLTGKVPFTGESPLVIAMKQVSDAPSEEMLADAPPDLAGIVLRALAKDPAERFPSAAALEAELGMVPLLPLGMPPLHVPIPLAIPVAPPPPPPPVLTAPTAPSPAARHVSGPVPPPATSASWPATATPAPPPPAVKAPPPRPTPAPVPVPAPATPPRQRKIQIPALPASEPVSPEMLRPLTRPISSSGVRPPEITRPPEVLIIEDEVDVRREIAEHLGRFRIKTWVAKNGQQGIELLLKQPVDLVLLDLTLPNMDGFDVTRVIKSQPSTSHIPIVLMTDRLDRNRFAFGIQVGATDLLQKPVALEAATVRLWNILTHRGFIPPPDLASLGSLADAHVRTASEPAAAERSEAP